MRELLQEDSWTEEEWSLEPILFFSESMATSWVFFLRTSLDCSWFWKELRLLWLTWFSVFLELFWEPLLFISLEVVWLLPLLFGFFFFLLGYTFYEMVCLFCRLPPLIYELLGPLDSLTSLRLLSLSFWPGPVLHSFSSNSEGMSYFLSGVEWRLRLCWLTNGFRFEERRLFEYTSFFK